MHVNASGFRTSSAVRLLRTWPLIVWWGWQTNVFRIRDEGCVRDRHSFWGGGAAEEGALILRRRGPQSGS